MTRISDILWIRVSWIGRCSEEWSCSLLLWLNEHNTLGLQFQYQKLSTNAKLKFKIMFLSKSVHCQKCSKKCLGAKKRKCTDTVNIKNFFIYSTKIFISWQQEKYVRSFTYFGWVNSSSRTTFSIRSPPMVRANS